MPTTLQSPPWPAPAAPSPTERPAPAIELADGGGDAAPQGASRRWAMRRHCSISPMQLLAVYALLCLVSLLIGAFFHGLGATYVAAFAGLELFALGAALFVHARHVADRETIHLQGRQVEVECVDGASVTRARFRAEWLAVEPVGGQGSLIALSGQGQRVLVGRLLRPDQRALLAQELRQALRRACLVCPPEPPGLPLSHAR